MIAIITECTKHYLQQYIIFFNRVSLNILQKSLKNLKMYKYSEQY